MNVRRMALAVASALAVAGCGGPVALTPDTAPSTSAIAGDPAVLERIKSLEDCGALQEEFELAFNSSEHAEPGTLQHRAATEYMGAAHERLEAVGCYGQ